MSSGLALCFALLSLPLFPSVRQDNNTLQPPQQWDAEGLRGLILFANFWSFEYLLCARCSNPARAPAAPPPGPGGAPGRGNSGPLCSAGSPPPPGPQPDLLPHPWGRSQPRAALCQPRGALMGASASFRPDAGSGMRRWGWEPCSRPPLPTELTKVSLFLFAPVPLGFEDPRFMLYLPGGGGVNKPGIRASALAPTSQLPVAALSSVPQSPSSPTGLMPQHPGCCLQSPGLPVTSWLGVPAPPSPALS